MAQDMIPSLAALLDGFTASSTERTQVFRFLEWGKHESQQHFSEAVGLTEGMVTLREVANPNANADMGGGAAKNRQSVDILVSFGSGDDLAGPGVSKTAMLRFRKAVVDAVKAIIHTNEKTISPATFTQVTNTLRDADSIVGSLGTGTLNMLVIVTVEGEMHEVYA